MYTGNQKYCFLRATISIGTVNHLIQYLHIKSNIFEIPEVGQQALKAEGTKHIWI